MVPPVLEAFLLSALNYYRVNMQPQYYPDTAHYLHKQKKCGHFKTYIVPGNRNQCTQALSPSEFSHRVSTRDLIIFNMWLLPAGVGKVSVNMVSVGHSGYLKR